MIPKFIRRLLNKDERSAEEIISTLILNKPGATPTDVTITQTKDGFSYELNGFTISISLLRPTYLYFLLFVIPEKYVMKLDNHEMEVSYITKIELYNLCSDYYYNYDKN